MKRLLFILMIVGIISNSSAILLLQENFNASSFPPPGWSVETIGDGNGNWMREVTQGRVCAFGYFYHESGPSTLVQTKLISKPFTLAVDESCTVTFLRWNRTYDTAWGVYKIQLLRDGVIVWEKLLPEVEGFTFTGITTTPQTLPSSNYQLVWYLAGTSGEYNGGAVTFYVDDVAIYSNLVASSYKSLGRIKADFK